MAAIIKPRNPAKIISTNRNMTPYQVYLAQVKGCMDQIRAEADGLTYTPPQMGGSSGQRAVIREKVVLQTIEYEVVSEN